MNSEDRRYARRVRNEWIGVACIFFAALILLCLIGMLP